jgi:hypothetical protein
MTAHEHVHTYGLLGHAVENIDSVGAELLPKFIIQHDHVGSETEHHHVRIDDAPIPATGPVPSPSPSPSPTPLPAPAPAPVPAPTPQPTTTGLWRTGN